MAQHEQLKVLDLDAPATAKQQLQQRNERQVDERQDHRTILSAPATPELPVGSGFWHPSRFSTLLSYAIGAVQVEHPAGRSVAGTAALANCPARTTPSLRTPQSTHNASRSMRSSVAVLASCCAGSTRHARDPRHDAQGEQVRARQVDPLLAGDSALVGGRRWRFRAATVARRLSSVRAVSAILQLRVGNSFKRPARLVLDPSLRGPPHSDPTGAPGGERRASV
jgi:hypothetical protein